VVDGIEAELHDHLKKVSVSLNLGELCYYHSPPNLFQIEIPVKKLEGKKLPADFRIIKENAKVCLSKRKKKHFD
jgi:hypothetical protein